MTNKEITLIDEKEIFDFFDSIIEHPEFLETYNTFQEETNEQELNDKNKAAYFFGMGYLVALKGVGEKGITDAD